MLQRLWKYISHDTYLPPLTTGARCVTSCDLICKICVESIKKLTWPAGHSMKLQRDQRLQSVCKIMWPVLAENRWMCYGNTSSWWCQDKLHWVTALLHFTTVIYTNCKHQNKRHSKYSTFGNVHACLSQRITVYFLLQINNVFWIEYADVFAHINSVCLWISLIK